MALADPLTLYSGTGITIAGQVEYTYAKQSEGRYIATTHGTADEPYLMTVSNDYRPGGTSVITARFTRAKNVTINGIPQADDILSASLQLKVPNKSFALADVQNLSRLVGFLTYSTTTLPQLLLGQR